MAEAIGTHYRPLGPGDAVPAEPVAVAVALADKLDQLVGFFAADERPTGSGDPYAMRRAALGIIRLIRENGLRLPLADVIGEAFFGYPQSTGSTASPEFGLAVAAETMKTGWPAAVVPPPADVAAFAAGLLDFLAERLRVQLRAEGARHDIVAAVFGAAPDDDLVRLLARSDALAQMLSTPDGANLLAAYKRAANILRIENRRDGPHDGPVDPALLATGAERALGEAVAGTTAAVAAALAAEDFLAAMAQLASLRAPVDAFFDQVVVNDADPQLRANRLRLLNMLCAAMDAVADVSKIEG